MVNTMLLAFDCCLVACTAISAGHSRYQGGRMKCVLTAERSSLTIALTLGASSSHDEKPLVAARSTSLINFCPRCAISLAGTWRNPVAIPRQLDRRRVDAR
jgi:hypothetical protein